MSEAGVSDVELNEDQAMASSEELVDDDVAFEEKSKEIEDLVPNVDEREEVLDKEDDVQTDSEAAVEEDSEEQSTVVVKEKAEKIVKLPLSRIKTIMKCDDEITITSAESVISIARCTELFIESLVKAMHVSMKRDQKPRKTLMIKDLENVVHSREEFSFLEGTLE